MLTDAQVAQVDMAVAELARELAEGVVATSYDYPARDGAPWGEAEEGDCYHSEVLYGSSQGPDAGTILWEDIASRLGLEEEAPDWSDELCEDLAHGVSDLLGERYPDRACACASWDDNCLFAVVSEQ